MRTRALGRTGVEVSELGYGAWGISRRQWIGAEDGESLRALHRAIELGVTFVDTALAYGDGHSEELVGRVVRESSETVVVATKVPPRNGEWPARPGVAVEDVFPGYWIAACADRSLRNLGLDTIDLLQLHVWDRGWVGRGDWEETVERLKADGKIRLFGVSINDHEPDAALPLVEAGLADSLQLIFNVFDQSPTDELFPVAAAADVGVIARVPFDEGSLTGNVTPETTFPEGDFRNEQETWERVNAIAADLGTGPGLERLPELALRFCISHPAVSTVIPGMRSVRNVEANAAAVELGPLSGAELETLARHRWDRNFYRH
jgi:aryl-alcohol dehydrogenase-like predicted oxidoreductase